MNSDESLGKRLFQISGNAIGVPLPNSQVPVYASTETVIGALLKHRQYTEYYTVPKLLPSPPGSKFLSFTNLQALYYILIFL